MKGYFSKIARQSGVRLGNQPVVQAGRMSDSAPPLPARIDRDEVVMVPQDPVAAPATKAPSVESKAISESQKAPVVPARTHVEEVRPPQPPMRSQETREDLHATSEILPDVKFERIDVAGSLPATEPSVSLEVSETTVVAPVDPEPQAPQPTTHAPVDHFADTLRIISGREVSKEESRATLVREIHEWIAAGSPETEVNVEKVVLPDRLPATPDIVEVVEREPGVVRIRGELVSKREDAPAGEGYPKPVESASIHEQTLDLSIGSINVVIEGDAAPQQVQQHAPRTVEPRNDTPRSSRLRRNYI